MLHITVPERELFDESTCEFISTKPRTLALEHSLVSISKWESKWKKPFLKNDEKSLEELQDYVRCMTLTQNIPPETYKFLTTENMQDISEYMNADMTATWFNEQQLKHSRKQSSETVTSELIYYWMVAYNIPFECQKWHLSRLMTLIRICMIKNSPTKKMSPKEVARYNRSLNAARKAQLNTRG